MKNVLIIGGTYFTGRVHAILTCKGQSVRNDLHLHLVNRGRYPISGLPNISQYVCDRHEAENLSKILPEGLYFDAVVDFCAYEPTDISQIIHSLNGRISQYIYISTCSVYDPSYEGIIDESAPVLKVFENNAVDSYVAKKALLETELISECALAGIPYTILRPSFIFGPFNYAPRESWFVKQINDRTPVPYPVDACGRFSFIYVMDVADIINYCIADERAYRQIFNLACDEVQTYESYFDVLRQCCGDFSTRSVTVDEVVKQNIALPFPLDEDQVYSGNKVSELFHYQYTPFLSAMKKTCSVLKAANQS